MKKVIILSFLLAAGSVSANSNIVQCVNVAQLSTLTLVKAQAGVKLESILTNVDDNNVYRELVIAVYKDFSNQGFDSTWNEIRSMTVDCVNNNSKYQRL